jgi:hypothetical protein
MLGFPKLISSLRADHQAEMVLEVIIKFVTNFDIGTRP